jgi:membrane-bound metal-dependent hydrolase YbcI (DUF457 family)
VDTLAHGLWGAVGFLPEGKKRFAAAMAIGMAPDLATFGVFHLTRPSWILARLAGEATGPPPLSILPEFVFRAYDLTHSLVVWAVLFAAVWWLARKPPALLLPWGLHILCDIPTHNSSYFPTPYLWPFDTPYVEGISWATGWFMAANYSALALAYATVGFCRGRGRRQ